MDAFLEFLGQLTINWRLVGIMAAGFTMLAVTGWVRGWHRVLTERMGKGVAATLVLLTINSALIPFAMAGVWALQNLYEVWRLPVIPPSFWDGVPALLVVVIAVVAFDFMDYVSHRLMHLPWLWPIHAVHHSDHDVNAFTTFRVHVLEVAFMKLSYVVGLSWLGVTPEAAGLGLVFLTLHNMYVHMDIDVDHGRLNWLIASPRFHRWHHADEPVAYGKNLANLVPLWDMLFGTYYVPGKCEKPTSAEGVPHANVPALMLFPMVEWFRMATKSAERRLSASKQGGMTGTSV
ncbi:MAG: sterol desaturase family protein [Pseudomonadota bacterium]